MSLVDAQVSKFYLDTACEYIEKAVSDKPEELDVYNLAARFFLENKKVEKAEQYIFKARDIVMARERYQGESLAPEIENNPKKVFERNHYEFFESNLIEIEQLRDHQ
ncbi:MAG: hypothetical protein D3924_00380 [Candidatus Electrothrix sp. AR4]|nr:hypothetical protein [Candidatus Electrothrix sp. AR4]